MKVVSRRHQPVGEFCRQSYPGMNEENVRLWHEYCAMRDTVIARHHEFFKRGERTPKNIWLFVVGRDPLRRFTPPDYIYPKRCKEWLQRAIRRCEGAINHPEGAV